MPYYNYDVVPADIKRRARYHGNRFKKACCPNSGITQSQRDYSMGYCWGYELYADTFPHPEVDKELQHELNSSLYSPSYKAGLRSFLKDNERIKWSHGYRSW